MSRVYDHESKQWIDLNDEEVDQAIQSGRYTFAQGMEIPVVSPSGKLGTIPAEEAADAFKEGFRWQTPADRDVDFQKKSQQIVQENFDNPALAAGLGAMSGATLGASDVAIRLGEESGLLPEGVTEARKNVKEISPIASGLGTAAGTVASTVLSGGLAGTAGAGAKALTGATEAALAAKGVGGLAKTAATLGVEGAYWGAGEGISEAALGAPEEIVDNLVTNVGLGALIGGGFGAALGTGKAAAPYLKKTLDSSLDVLGGAARGTAKTIAKELVRPVMALRGEQELFKKFGELANDPDLTKALADGGMEAAEKVFKEKNVIARELTKESKVLGRNLKDAIKNASEDEANSIRELLAASDNDVRQALSTAQSQLEEIGGAFDTFKSTLTDMPVWGDELVKSTEKQAINLGKYGTEAKALAKEIAAKTKAYGSGMTEGTELQMIRDIKALTNQEARKSLTGAAHEQAKKIWKEMDDLLKNQHPRDEVRNYMKTYDTVYGARANLDRAFSKSVGKGGGIENFLFSPVTQQQISPMLKNLKEFVPELQAIREAGETIGKRTAAYNRLMDRYRQVAGQSIDSSNMTQFKEVVDDLIKDPKILKNSQRLEQIQAAMQDVDSLNPYDATVRLYKATGRDIAGLEKYAKFGQRWDELQALKLRSSSVGLAEQAAGYLSGGWTLPITAVKAAGSNPLMTLKVLGKVNNAVSAGQQMLSKSLSSMGKAVVSKPVASVSSQLVRQGESRKQRKERYDRVRNQVADLSSPEAMASAIEQLGGGNRDMPQIKLALGLRLQGATAYLQQALPVDPLAQYAVGPTKSPWQPSDMDIARYLSKVEAVNSPLSVVDRIKDGTATLDMVDAIKNVHPDIYNQLQSSIMSAIMEHGDQIPYQRRVQLGTLFSIPTDYSMTPEFIAAMQAPYQPKDLGGRPTGSRSKNIDISPFASVQTETSRITYGDQT